MKLLMILLVGMSVLMTPLSAPDGKSGMEKTSEQKAQEELNKKVEQQKLDEARQALRLEALRKEQEERVAEEHAKKLQDEVATKKGVAEALDALLAAQKKYEARDIKAGDALLQNIGELLKGLNIEELKSIITSMNLKPEVRLALLRNSADALSMSLLGTANIPLHNGFTHLMVVLFDSLSANDLQKLLDTKSGVEALNAIAKQLMSVVKAPRSDVAPDKLTPVEKLCIAMVEFTKKLVQVLNDTKAYSEQREIALDILLQWAHQIPVSPVLRAQFLAAFDTLNLEFLPRDYQSLKDWFMVFKDFKHDFILHGLFLNAVKNDGSLEALRDGIRMLNGMIESSQLFELVTDYLLAIGVEKTVKNLREAIETLKNIGSLRPSVLRDLRGTYLETISTVGALRSITDVDRALIIESLGKFMARDPKNATPFFTSFLTNLPLAIKTLDAESKGNLAPQIKASLDRRLATLRTLYEQIAALALPEQALSKALWKQVALNLNASNVKLIPALFMQDVSRIESYVFGITAQNKQEHRLNYIDSLKRFVTFYDFYADFPHVQQALVAMAQQYYGQTLSQKTKAELLPEIGLNPAVQSFLDRTASPHGFLGYSDPRSLRKELLKLAIEKSFKHDFRYILSLSPDVFHMSDVISSTYFTDNKAIDIFYIVVKAMSDEQFARFAHDVASQAYIPKDLPIIFGALSHCTLERAKVLLDAIVVYKNAFDEKYGLSTFSISDDLIKNAYADIEKRAHAQKVTAQQQAAIAEKTKSLTRSLSSISVSSTPTPSSRALTRLTNDSASHGSLSASASTTSLASLSSPAVRS